ncbi:MAG TPA: hypothetical protein VHP33_10430 [Polyangiaceae bacterium]|nr:hypothetical protein [Polyangiaceae bacterium]
MTDKNTNRTRKPPTPDRVYVSELVERMGVVKAAQALGMSRLATLNIAHGGDCYPSTLARVRHAMGRIIA